MEQTPETVNLRTVDPSVSCGALFGAFLGAAFGLFGWFVFGRLVSAGWLGEWYIWSIAGALVGATVVCLQGHARRRRSQRVGEVSRQLGLAFTACPTSQQLTRLAGHLLPSVRDSGWAWNLMEGRRDGLELAVLDIEEPNLDSETQSRQQQTVVTFTAVLAGLPNFSLRSRQVGSGILIWLFRRLAPWLYPEGDRLAARIDLSGEVEQEGDGGVGDGSFSKPDMLAGDFAAGDPQGECLRRLFTRDLRGLLAKDPGWNVVLCQGQMVLWRGDSWCKPDELAALLEGAVAVFRLFAARAQPASPTVGTTDNS
jgi:hypothetical protein